METVNGRYEDECVRTFGVHDDACKTVADVKCASAGWVDWYKERRLDGSLAMMAPVEFVQAHCAALNRERQHV